LSVLSTLSPVEQAAEAFGTAFSRFQRAPSLHDLVAGLPDEEEWRYGTSTERSDHDE